MDLERYVTELRAQLAATAGAGDADAQALAERLSLALEAAARLMVLEVLSDAASEITREIAPGSVDVVLRGRDPHLLVTRPAESAFFSESTTGMAAVPQDAVVPAEPHDDTVTSRTTLRLPDRLKARVEEAAAEDGLSVNSWLVRAISTALEPKIRRAAKRETRGGDNFTGWAR
ncbi:HicB family protein [Micromonospora pallida]|uniref:HicB family protein n=1 Tax=Micromonospora pallida TaxID=145854 RepID=A0A1C6TD79_9ACTN|nr:toxin-antitoxin system HicB family antitoxin [Micromonospora pallida]SCL39405.1 HicB family protein [Micromonospora pallida]